jgi:hypothetical protein
MTVLDTTIDAVFAWEAPDSRGNRSRLPGLPRISPAGQIIPSARER